MSDQGQSLAQQYDALMTAALSQPGVAVAMEVFESSQTAVAVAQYAFIASTTTFATVPANSSMR
jgi:hypothetical protein